MRLKMRWLSILRRTLENRVLSVGQIFQAPISMIPGPGYVYIDNLTVRSKFNHPGLDRMEPE